MSNLTRLVGSHGGQRPGLTNDLPAVHLSYVRTQAADCPGCRLRRSGAYADTRLLSYKAACLRHGYWLLGQGGQRLNLAMIPEVAAAQRRLDRIASRQGPTAAMRACKIASGYLQYSWRSDYHPRWYPALVDRWQQRVLKAGAFPAHSTWQMPDWAVDPECTALASVLAGRDFTAEMRGGKMVMVGDITYIFTWEGWLYLLVTWNPSAAGTVGRRPSSPARIPT